MYNNELETSEFSQQDEIIYYNQVEEILPSENILKFSEEKKILKTEKFLEERKINVEPLDSAIDSFDRFFTEKLLRFLLVQINKRIKRKHDIKKHEENSMNQCIIKEITLKELKYYLAIIIYMGICKLPELKMYWGNSCVNHLHNILSKN